MSSSDINFIGEAIFRGERKKFGIKIDDRRRHIYIIGKTGMGKTALLKNLAVQDIRLGRGLAFIDPHGEAAEELLSFVPKERIKDVCYFNPGDIDWPMSFNVMEAVDVEHRHLVASGLMEVFKKIWPDVWSARMEYILHNTILALLEYPGSTLLGINRMLADVSYREKVVDNIKDPVIKAFWVHEFARYTQRLEVEATAAIQNKIGQFISSPLIRNIIGQERSSIDMRRMMDNGKIFIVNLSKGKIGEDASKLLGGLLITKLQLAAMSRVDTPESERRDFFLYVDEFQNFATESFCNILSEARKYRLSLVLAHQYIAQMEESVRDAVFGNVGTIISFRVGAEDAEFLEKEFLPNFNANDFVNLPKYHIYIKLMVDGVAGKPFSAVTIAPPFPEKESFRDEIIKYSREQYATSRSEVERQIAEWTGDFILSEQKNRTLNKGTSAPTVELFDAQCERCGKWVKVPFKPEPGRPIYCKSCLKKIEKEKNSTPLKSKKKYREETEKKEHLIGRPLTLEELLLKNPIPFGSKPKKDKTPPESNSENDKENEGKNKKEDSQKTKESKSNLKELIKKAVSLKNPPQRGSLKPGESVKF